MKKTMLAVVLGLSSLSVQADVRNVLQTLEQGHEDKNWNTVISTYRGAKSNPDVRSWFLRQVNSGHPMYLLEKANEDLGSGNIRSATTTALKGYLNMTADMSICMDMQAKQLALQHMASYKDLNMYFNRNQKTTLEIINDTIKKEKNDGTQTPSKYDDTWVCHLTNKPNMLLPEKERGKMKKAAMMTYLVVTRSTLELTGEMMDAQDPDNGR